MRCSFAVVALSLASLLSTAEIALAAPGDLDPAYGKHGIHKAPPSEYPPETFALTVRPNGGAVFYRAVPQDAYGEDYEGRIIALTKQGASDLNFGSGGSVADPGNIGGGGLFSEPDGGVVRAGYVYPTEENRSDVGAMRLTPYGNADLTFGPGGVARPDLPEDDSYGTDGVPTSDNGTVISVSLDEGRAGELIKVDRHGNLDPSFGTDGVSDRFDGEPEYIAMDDAGDIFVDSDQYFLEPEFHEQSSVRRFSAGGSLDHSYGEDGVAAYPTSNDTFSTDFGFEVGPGGNAVITRQGEVFGPSAKTFSTLYALDRSGAVDPDFDPTAALAQNPKTGRSFVVAQVLEDRQGRYLLGGSLTRTDKHDHQNGLPTLARLLPDGSLDKSFGEGGFSTFVPNAVGIRPKILFPAGLDDIALQDDGKVVAVGSGSALRFLTSRGRANADADRLDDSFDSCPRLPAYAARSNGCPRVSVSITMHYSAARGFKGQLKAVRGCRVFGVGDPHNSHGVEITVKRVEPGRDVSIGTTLDATTDGAWHLSGSRHPGNGHYYAIYPGRINQSLGRCAKAKSPRVPVEEGTR